MRNGINKSNFSLITAPVGNRSGEWVKKEFADPWEPCNHQRLSRAIKGRIKIAGKQNEFTALVLLVCCGKIGLQVFPVFPRARKDPGAQH